MLPDKEMAALEEVLRNVCVPGRHLEIGTAYGRTLIRMLSIFPPESRPRFWVVDTMDYFPNQLEHVRGNLSESGLAESVEFLPMASALALARAEEGAPFAFIFVDGDHSISGVTVDLQWARFLSKGGWLCLHDYGPKEPGVVLAVDRFLKHNPNYRKIRQVESVLVVQKQDESRGPEITRWDLLRARLLAPLLRLRRSIWKRLGGRRGSASADVG